MVSMFCRININAKMELPIRSSEMGLLIFVRQSEKPPTSADAVAFFKVSKPMVAAMVRSLEKKGYLARGKSEDVRRRFSLVLTPTGEKLVEETTGEYFKNMALLRDGLGAKKYDSLMDLLEEANGLLLGEEKNKN